jgi:predicted dinucleotide-binding enzyme
MIIGTIGAGDMATTIAGFALRAGHEVRLSGRNQAKLAQVVAQLGTGASAATPREVAEADIIILAVNWPDVAAALAACPSLDGKIVVDATNPLLQREPVFKLADFGDRISSEIVADQIPRARIVKAFNTIRTEDFRNGPRRGDARRVIMFSGDDTGAKATVKALIESFGFVAIDLGGLVSGGRLQSMGGPLATGHDFLIAGDSMDERV